MKLIDLTGHRYGRLLVEHRVENDRFGKPRWACRCDCGNHTVVASAELRKKGRGTKSCGCLVGKKQTHGMSRHPAFAVWRSMLARCNNPNHFAYHNYGGRGIFVCAEWGSFGDFWRDMGGTYSGLALDRIDNDEGYSKDNCRWTTMRVQAQNRRGARLVSFGGELVNVSEAARKSGVRANTILYRIAHGWPEDRLFDKADFRNRVVK